jgi:hypothetical protein
LLSGEPGREFSGLPGKLLSWLLSGFLSGQSAKQLGELSSPQLAG